MSSHPKPLTRELCIELAGTIEEGFERNGVAIRSSSDIAFFIKEIRWLADQVDSSPEKLTGKETTRWVEAFLRVQQAKNISFIFERLAKVQIPQQKLIILQKRLDYLNQQGHSHAPDHFFELEVAARLAHEYPGWNIDFGDPEPDIIIEYPDGRAGFVCKRPKSERALSSRLSDAADQGSNAKIPFFILVDAQEMLKSAIGAPLINANSQEDLAKICSDFLANLLLNHQRLIEHALAKGAGGVTFCVRGVGYVASPPSICFCLRHKSCPNLAMPGAAYALNFLTKLMEE